MNSSDSPMAATTMLQAQDILMTSAFPLDAADSSMTEDLPDAAAAGSGSGVPDFVKKLYRQVCKPKDYFFSAILTPSRKIRVNDTHATVGAKRGKKNRSRFYPIQRQTDHRWIRSLPKKVEGYLTPSLWTRTRSSDAHTPTFDRKLVRCKHATVRFFVIHRHRFAVFTHHLAEHREPTPCDTHLRTRGV